MTCPRMMYLRQVSDPFRHWHVDTDNMQLRLEDEWLPLQNRCLLRNLITLHTRMWLVPGYAPSLDLFFTNRLSLKKGYSSSHTTESSGTRLYSKPLRGVRSSKELLAVNQYRKYTVSPSDFLK